MGAGSNPGWSSRVHTKVGTGPEVRSLVKHVMHVRGRLRVYASMRLPCLHLHRYMYTTVAWGHRVQVGAVLLRANWIITIMSCTKPAPVLSKLHWPLPSPRPHACPVSTTRLVRAIRYGRYAVGMQCAKSKHLENRPQTKEKYDTLQRRANPRV